MAGSLPPGWVMLVASWLTQAEGAAGHADAAALALAQGRGGRRSAGGGLRARTRAGSRMGARVGGPDDVRRRTTASRAAKIARSAGMHAMEMLALHTAVDSAIARCRRGWVNSPRC
jgi:hypothetical protein